MKSKTVELIRGENAFLPKIHLHARATVFEGCLADFFVAGMLEIRYSVKPSSIPGSSNKKEEPGVKRMRFWISI